MDEAYRYFDLNPPDDDDTQALTQCEQLARELASVLGYHCTIEEYD